MTLQFSDQILPFEKSHLNKSNTDIYVVPFKKFEENSTYSLNLTWDLIEFSKDFR